MNSWASSLRLSAHIVIRPPQGAGLDIGGGRSWVSFLGVNRVAPIADPFSLRKPYHDMSETSESSSWWILTLFYPENRLISSTNSCRGNRNTRIKWCSSFNRSCVHLDRHDFRRKPNCYTKYLNARSPSLYKRILYRPTLFDSSELLTNRKVSVNVKTGDYTVDNVTVIVIFSWTKYESSYFCLRLFSKCTLHSANLFLHNIHSYYLKYVFSVNNAQSVYLGRQCVRDINNKWTRHNYNER